MNYIDKYYYDNTYCGEEIKEEDFEKYANRASDIVKYITFGRADKIMESQTEEKKCEAIKKATAAQTEVFALAGNEAYTGQHSSRISREELGNAAISYDIQKKNVAEIFGVPISGISMCVLSDAGLLYKGI